MEHTGIITKLGGSTAISRWLNQRFPVKITPQAVNHWRGRGVPASWRLAISTMAGERGIELPDDFLLPLTGTLPDDSGDHIIMEVTK